MGDHPCHRHRPGRHTEKGLNGPCGFCGTDLLTVASGECRSCLRLVCEDCDGGYEPDLGPICGPCAPADTPDATDPVSAEGRTLDRLCVFELALSCGHRVTMAVTGWYPVSVACCDRLGGTVLRGRYVPYFSQVDYVRLRSERYRYRSAGVPRRPGRLLDRQPRTDEPRPSPRPGDRASSGRFPARVGATWSVDGSAPSPPPR